MSDLSSPRQWYMRGLLFHTYFLIFWSKGRKRLDPHRALLRFAEWSDTNLLITESPRMVLCGYEQITSSLIPHFSFLFPTPFFHSSFLMKFTISNVAVGTDASLGLLAFVHDGMLGKVEDEETHVPF